MKVLNLKKTKYEQVAEILDKEGYLSDTNAFKIWGSEEGIYKQSEHVRIWRKLQQDRNSFSDRKVVELKKGHRSHLVRFEGMGENQYYKIGKEYFKELRNLTKK
jgi:ribosomal protein S8